MRLSGADLRRSDLSGVLLEGATLSRARLQGADRSGGAAPGVDLSAANLGGARLGEVHCESAVLKWSDLMGCSFHMGSSGSGLVFSPNLCEGSRTGFYSKDFDERQLAPESVRKADLRGADLVGARIHAVDFYLVDVRGARVTRAQYDWLRLCRAILDGVVVVG